MNFGKLVKMAKGVTTMDEALEVLSLIGVETEIKPVPLEAVAVTAELEQLVAMARKSGKGFHLVEANVKGLPLRAFVVVGTPQAKPS